MTQPFVHFMASLFFVLFGLPPALASTQLLPPVYVAQEITIQTAYGPVTLRAGTQVVVEPAQTFNTKNLSVGQTVNVRVKYNVVVNKQIVIAAGAPGTAIISKLTKPRSFGRGSEAEFQVQSVQTTDQQQCPLSGIPLIVEGDDKKGLAIGLCIGLGLITIPILCVGALSGLFIKGKHAEIPAGTSLNANVASDIEVDPPSRN